MTQDEEQGGSDPAGDYGHGMIHVPVLRREVLDSLDLRPGLVVVDGTVGAAGHGRDIVTGISPEGQYVGLDRDPEILARAQAALGGAADARARISFHSVLYSQMRGVLGELGLTACDRVFLDIGVSSMQIDTPERGFSFQLDGALDMRMNQAVGQPLGAWLQRVSEKELARVIHEYGEEWYSRRIAQAIVQARERRGGLHRTLELADVIRRAVPTGRRQKIHPATRTFQALRIVINDELGELERGLQAALECLSEQGRLVVITFHSLEDRIVKRFMRDHMELAFRRPMVPTGEECRANPRARSAKLRCAIKNSEVAA